MKECQGTFQLSVPKNSTSLFRTLHTSFQSCAAWKGKYGSDFVNFISLNEVDTSLDAWFTCIQSKNVLDGLYCNMVRLYIQKVSQCTHSTVKATTEASIKQRSVKFLLSGSCHDCSEVYFGLQAPGSLSVTFSSSHPSKCSPWRAYLSILFKKRPLHFRNNMKAVSCLRISKLSDVWPL